MGRRNKKRSGRNALFTVSTIVLIIIILGVAGLVVLRPDKNVSYYWDADLGVVTVKIFKPNIFEQAVTFTQTSVDVGSEITLIDAFTVPGNLVHPTDPSIPLCIDQAEIFIIRPATGEQLILVDTSILNILPGDNFETQITHTVDVPGVWTARTEYRVVECIGGGAVVSAISESSTNTVSVSDPDPTCPTDPGFNNWAKDRDISNGQIDIREYFEYQLDSNNICTLVSDMSQTQYRTTCNTGYVITGTNDNVGSGELSCEAIDTGQNDTTTGCTGDVTTACSDGTTVTTMTCTNGQLASTGNTCPAATNTTATNTTANNTQQNTTVGGDTGTSTGDDDGSSISTILIFSVLGLVIVGGIIGIIVLVVRRK
jgi:hypothetical protein